MTKYLLLLCLFISFCASSQSTLITAGNTGSVGLPKLSYEQIMAIPNPQAGMMAFDSTFKCLKYYNGSKWLCTTQNGNNNNPIGFAWKKTVYSNGYESPIAMKLDNQNNIYITGVVGTYPVIYGYVAKFSPNGNLIWEYTDFVYHASTIGDIAIDDNGQVYAICNTSYNGSGGIGILKFDTNGNFLTRFGLGGNRYDYRYGYNLWLDNNQNLYVTGRFTTYLQTGSFSITANTTTYEGFVAKFGNDGSPQWLKPTRNGLISKLTRNGDCYFTGNFTGSVSIEGNTLNASGNEDMLIGKYNNDGALAWVKRAGGIGTDKANDLSIDNEGNVYVVGSFSGNAYFDTTPANAIDAEDFYVVKYRSDGLFIWLRNGGGTGIDSGMKIELSSDNQPIILGSASSNMLTFYPNFIMNPTMTPSNFLIKYDAGSGNISWAKVVEDADGLRINSQSEIYTWKSIAVGSSDPNNSIGNYNIITKYLSDGTMAYKLINGGPIRSFVIGVNKRFFFTGGLTQPIQVGASILTNNDAYGDIFISHWME